MTATPRTISPPDAPPTPLGPVEFVASLERQVVLYRQLHALAAGQGKAVDASDTAALAALLSRRQAIIDQLEALTAALAPRNGSPDQMMAGLSPAQRDRTAAICREIESLRQAVLTQDVRDATALRHIRGSVGDELQRINRTGIARRAYRTHAPPAPPRFTDGRG
jgi:hypothetical protein